MSREAVIIDCDPGQDDAVLLLLALGARDRLDIRGITTVAGNVPLARTGRNARILLDLAGHADVPVFAGCPGPLLRPLRTAEEVHGSTGIAGIEDRDPSAPLQDRHAVDFLIEQLGGAAPASVTLVAVGPLTNLAVAMIQAPAIVAGIRRIVIMGGAWREGGNTTPAAEFNTFVDPHAAHVVYRCGRPITVVSVDVSLQVLSSAARIERIAALGTPVAAALAGMLRDYNRFHHRRYGSDGGPLYDPLCVAWLLRPELFEGRQVNLEVEIASELSMGSTVVDYWGVSGRPANVTWLHSVDADGFFALLVECIARL